MALIVPGALVSVLSGKVGGTVFARNRGGNYARSYAIPTVVTSARAQWVKSVFGVVSQAYANLTAPQVLAWDQYGRENPQSNRIGQLITLKGQSWYVACNSRLLLMGDTLITLPPILPAPLTVPMGTLTVDVNGGVATLVVPAHPATANVRLALYGARSVSAGRRYVENLWTHLTTFDAGEDGATVSFGTELAAALGSIQEGVTYHVAAEFIDDRTGLVSVRQRLSTVAVDTT